MAFQELMEASFDYQTNNMYTALPGIIVTVRDSFNQLSVDVQPTVSIKNKDGTMKDRPVVMNVPVQMPSSSTAALTFPVNVGDPVLLVYAMRSMDTWKRGEGRTVLPNDNRKFDKRDCIAIPGIWPFSRSINNPTVRMWAHDTGDLVIVNNIGSGSENEVRLQLSGNIIVNTNQDVEVNCNNATVVAQSTIDMSCTDFILDASSNISITAATADITIPTTTWIGNITQTGTYTLTGNISQSGNYTGTGVQTFNGVIFSTHDHIPGPGPSNP